MANDETNSTSPSKPEIVNRVRIHRIKFERFFVVLDGEFLFNPLESEQMVAWHGRDISENEQWSRHPTYVIAPS